jgi:hypothetical protein
MKSIWEMAYIVHGMDLHLPFEHHDRKVIISWCWNHWCCANSNHSYSAPNRRSKSNGKGVSDAETDLSSVVKKPASLSGEKINMAPVAHRRTGAFFVAMKHRAAVPGAWARPAWAARRNQRYTKFARAPVRAKSPSEPSPW